MADVWKLRRLARRAQEWDAIAAKGKMWYGMTPEQCADIARQLREEIQAASQGPGAQEGGET